MYLRKSYYFCRINKILGVINTNLMVVTNKNKIVLRMRILIALLIIDVSLVVAGYILKSFIEEDIEWLLLSVSVILFSLILTSIMRLRVFHFENTGAVFSIKYYHPIKRGIVFPCIDYPVNRLRAFKMKRSLLAKIVIIEVNSQQKENPLRIKVKASNISDKDYHRMIKSFV